MIPIKKLIYVTDEFGHTYTPTYPKRAAGLVKHGRAHYVSDDTICLVCPPFLSETEEQAMTEMQNPTNMTAVAETTATVTEPETAQPTPTEPITADSGISLETAIQLLNTIARNGHEAVGFWAAKAAYSGVYRTAVKNGWIVDGLFVTDIPEGVDGGFLAADMKRIALMAQLLAQLLSDRLPAKATSAPISQNDTDALSETLRAVLSETIGDFADEFDGIKEDALGELEDAKEEFLAELRALKDELLGEIEAARNN